METSWLVPGMKSISTIVIIEEYRTCPPHGGRSWEHHLPYRHLLHPLSLPGTGQGLGTVCEEAQSFHSPSFPWGAAGLSVKDTG